METNKAQRIASDIISEIIYEVLNRINMSSPKSNHSKSIASFFSNEPNSCVKPKRLNKEKRKKDTRIKTDSNTCLTVEHVKTLKRKAKRVKHVKTTESIQPCNPSRAIDKWWSKCLKGKPTQVEIPKQIPFRGATFDLTTTDDNTESSLSTSECESVNAEATTTESFEVEIPQRNPEDSFLQELHCFLQEKQKIEEMQQPESNISEAEMDHESHLTEIQMAHGQKATEPQPNNTMPLPNVIDITTVYTMFTT